MRELTDGITATELGSGHQLLGQIKVGTVVVVHLGHHCMLTLSVFSLLM